MKAGYLTIIILVTIFSVSCDKIESPYTQPVPAKEWYGKKVLIEDYTGHKCPNCPAAAIVANDIKSQYGEKVVVISVHAGFFAKPYSGTFSDDFRTPAGDAWDDYFKISNVGNPNGLINRKGYPTSSHVINPNSWAASVSEKLKEIPEIEIIINKYFNENDTSVSGNVNIKYLKTLKKKLKLQIVITEDSIIAPQQNASSIIIDYTHRHMLRSDLNGIWGENISDGQSIIPIDTKISKTFFRKLNSNWKPEHCTIIAFVYDDNTKEILQSEEIHIE